MRLRGWQLLKTLTRLKTNSWLDTAMIIFNSRCVEGDESEHATSPFWGYCVTVVTVVFGRKGWLFCNKNPGPLEQYVSNRKPFKLEGSESITCMLPQESVYLTGLSFAWKMPEHVHAKSSVHGMV